MKREKEGGEEGKKLYTQTGGREIDYVQGKEKREEWKRTDHVILKRERRDGRGYRCLQRKSMDGEGKGLRERDGMDAWKGGQVGKRSGISKKRKEG